MNATRQVTVQGATRTLDCLEPWLDDGNIILVVEDKCFCAHRTTLGSYSKIFRDMFAIPHSDDTEQVVIDGCPVVYLQDAVDDVQIMLRALYDRSFVFFPDTPMPISVLKAFLRMGKKYVIQQLFEEARRRLSDKIPLLVHASLLSAEGGTSLFPRISENDPFNFAVVNIANEAGLCSTVVFATFYICVACPPEFIANGYVVDGKTYTLSSTVKNYCLLGQCYLKYFDKHMINSFASLRPSRCGGNSCDFTILSIIRSFQELGCPFAVWVPAWDQGLCIPCRAGLRKRHEEARNKLWKDLPIWLGFKSWEDLDKDIGLSDAE